MASYQALASVGLSIVALLQRRFDEDADAAPQGLTAFLAGANELKTMRENNGQLIQRPAISVNCYRITVDKETRPGWAAAALRDGTAHLPLRMHLLIASWADNAADELRWLGLAARVLDSDPILMGPGLDSTGEWGATEAIQIVTDDLAFESMSEASQALSSDLRLTLPYIARVVCIDGATSALAEPVATVADRLERVGS